MESNRIKNTARNMLASTIFRIINLAFPFFINTIIIQTLGVEYLGLNMLFSSILQVLSLTELGFGSAMVFSMYEPIAKGDTAKVSALLALYRKVYLIIGCVIIGIGLVCIPILPHIINGDVPDGLNLYILFIINLVNTSITYFLFTYRSSLLIAHQRNDIVDKINIFIEIALNISKIIILLATKDYYLFTILLPIYAVINSFLVFVVSKKLYPDFRCEGVISKAEKKYIFSRVYGISVNKLCYVLSNSFDNVVISGFLGLAILGQYNNYFVLANAVVMFMRIITVSATSSIGNSIVCESKEKNYKDFKMFQFIFSMIMGWAAICILCLNQPFIKLWVGEELMFDSATAMVFAVFMYAKISGEVFMAYREAAGIWEHDKVRPFLEGILNLCLNIVFVQIIGVIGVIVSTIITMGFIRTIWGSYYLFKEYFTEYSHKKYLLTMLHYLIFTIIAGAISYYLCSLITLDNILGLIIKLLTCTLVTLSVYLLVYFRSNELKNIFKLTKEIIHRPKNKPDAE